MSSATPEWTHSALRCLLQVLLVVLLLQTSSTSGGPCEKQNPCGCTNDQVKEKQTTGIDFWPGGIVFYVIEKEFPDLYTARIRRVINELEDIVGRTYIEFVEAISKGGIVCRKHIVHVRTAKGKAQKCASMLGFQLAGPTLVWLSEDLCKSDSDILRPLLTAIGIGTEENRPDRLKYVKLRSQHIAQLACDSFRPYPSEYYGNHHPYETGSFMHTSSCYGSCDGEFVMTTLNGSQIEPSSNLTFEDVRKVRHVYPKSQKVPFVEGKHCVDKEPEKPVVFQKRSGATSKRVKKPTVETDSTGTVRPWGWAVLLLLGSAVVDACFGLSNRLS